MKYWAKIGQTSLLRKDLESLSLFWDPRCRWRELSTDGGNICYFFPHFFVHTNNSLNKQLKIGI